MLPRLSGELRRLLRSTCGATAVEYGLLASLIAAVIVGGVSATGTNLNAVFNRAATLIP